MKYYEKGDRPVEIVTTRQWYIKNGATDDELRGKLISRGKELQFHPEHMLLSDQSAHLAAGCRYIPHCAENRLVPILKQCSRPQAPCEIVLSGMS